VTVAPEFALALIVALVSATGSFFATKFGGQETQRLVKALHGRFDDLEKDVRKVREVQIRHDERIRAQEEDIRSMKRSQQFQLRSRLAVNEAAEAGQPPMFNEEDE
jgi:hypothetical protein